MMSNQRRIFGRSAISLTILLAALALFFIHLYSAPGYGFFGDELYTIALSRHLAFGYVDLPPLVPALVALSRAVLGDSLFALHIVPALAGSVTLIFVCLIAKELGGQLFAVMLSALGFIVVPIWLSVDSIFCYDCIDQLMLAVFLYTLVRFLRTGNHKLWILLGLIAGIACMTKATILFLGPGLVVALLVSKYRRDVLTPWPWLGALLCLIVIAPYLFWQIANHWPTVEYWTNYGVGRVYQASVTEYLTSILVYMNPLLLPLWIVGLFRLFRPFDRTNYACLGVMFIVTLVLMFLLHAPARLLAELFIPLLAAGAIFVEEKAVGRRWEKGAKTAALVYLLAGGVLAVPLSLPIVPPDQLSTLADPFNHLRPQDFNGGSSRYSPLLTGRLRWDELVQDVAQVYNDLSPQDRAVAGIYADWYSSAGAIDLLGPRSGLPHAVSGALTYYLWGPGYSWEVMIIVTDKSNEMTVFFDECERAATARYEYDSPVGRPNFYICRKPKISADEIWSSMALYR
ncbi:hypothetical protein TFLX_03090 [Thermoflexales bacterium]|nr:hypothetical protein TFLX_03090 [Thermoflexales bacterium]